MPLFVATTSIGDMSFSKALFKNEKHSMSNICTSSMNSTPGTMSALPSSRHSATLESICSLTSCLISPVSPANNARKPCRRACFPCGFLLLAVAPDRCHQKSLCFCVDAWTGMIAEVSCYCLYNLPCTWARKECDRYSSTNGCMHSAVHTCVLLLMTSISCRVTTCTTSLRFCSSPSGHCTNLVDGPACNQAFLRAAHV